MQNEFKLIVKSKITRVVLIVLGALYLFAVTYYAAHQLKLDTGFPAGADAYGHLAQIKFWQKNFPHSRWNPYWYFGSTAFPSGYPPLYHAGLGLVAKYAHLDAASVMRSTALLAVLLIVLSLFAIAFMLTRSLLLALLVPLLLIATGAFWTFLVEFGLHVRVFALALYCLFLLTSLAYFKISKKQQATSNWSNIFYPLIIITFTLVLLSHLLIGAIATLTLAVLTGAYGQKGSRLTNFAKLTLTSFGLAAFYYIPYLAMQPVHLPLFGYGDDPEYAFVALKPLLTQRYPGFGFFLLPLTLILLFAVTFIEEKGEIREKKEIKGAKIGFYLFAFLGLWFVAYAIGFWPLRILSLYPTHAPFFAAFFLALSVIFGTSFLGGQTISAVFLATLIIVISAQALTVDRAVGNLSRFANFVSANNKINLPSIDENKNYRFANFDQKIAGIFNLASDGLQTRGYFTQAIAYPEFYSWFEEAVFKKDQNTPETKFLLDWLAINNLLLPTDNKYITMTTFAKYDLDSDFLQVNSASRLYVKSSPIFVATDAKPVWINFRYSSYPSSIKQIAQKDLSLDKLIPLKFAGDKHQDVPIVTSPVQLDGLYLESARSTAATLKAIYINPEHWEVILPDAYPGLVFKQNYSGNWHARLLTDGWSQDLKIYQAGPDMMYVFLPKFSQPAKVSFEYGFGKSEILGIIITLGTILWLIGRQIIKLKSLWRKNRLIGKLVNR